MTHKIHGSLSLTHQTTHKTHGIEAKTQTVREWRTPEPKKRKRCENDAPGGTGGKRGRFFENFHHYGAVSSLSGKPNEIAESECYFRVVWKRVITLTPNSGFRRKGLNGAGVIPFFSKRQKRGPRRRLFAIASKTSESSESDVQFFSSNKKGTTCRILMVCRDMLDAGDHSDETFCRKNANGARVNATLWRRRVRLPLPVQRQKERKRLCTP